MPLGSLSSKRKRTQSLVIKYLENGDYFVIIASSSHPLLPTEYAANGPVEAPPKQM